MRVKITIIIITIIIIVLLGAIFFYTSSQPPQSNIRTVVAKRQDVVQDVIVTGHLQPKQVSQLSFESTGTISKLFVSAGDIVTANTPLAQLETTLADLDVAKSSADLSAAQEQKKIAWLKAKETWQNTQAQNNRAVATKKQTVRDKKAELDQYRAIHEQVAREQADDDSTTLTAAANVKLAETAYHNAQQALAETLKSADKSNSQAQKAADLARAQYLATTQAAGNVAGLSSLEAAAAIAKHNLTQKTITAPFDGTVTFVNKEVGETVTASESVVTVATTDQLELKANITETDTAKLSLGMPATINFDALPPQDQWEATLTKISPAAKIIEGVPTYEITLQINNLDSRLRPGMTANITIHANTKRNVLAIPRRAVATRDGQQFVKIKEPDGQISEHQVTTGLVGSDGKTEITSGLSENQSVVISTTPTK